MALLRGAAWDAGRFIIGTFALFVLWTLIHAWRTGQDPAGADHVASKHQIMSS
jgi:hypothetical protein